MADNNIQLNLTAQDQMTPVLSNIAAALKRLETAGEENLAWVTQLSASLGSQQQAAQAAMASTNQLAAAYLAQAQAIREQTQGYTQAQAATLAYRREQDQLRAALQQQREEQRRATEETRASSAAWQQMLSVAAGVGLATSIGSLVSQLRQFVTESVLLAAKMQDLNLAFKSIEGSGAAANATLSHLFETSQRLGINFVEIAEGFKRMDQAAKGTALEGQGIRQVFDNVLAGARVLGVSSQQTHQAIVALEQILTKGKLSAEEYRRQLGNAIPGALKLMADGLGVTTQELERMIASGIIPAQAAVVAFGKAMGDLGSAQGQGTIERLTSTFAQLKNETSAWMTALGESIGSTLQPFLQDLIKISEEARKLLGLKPPGTQATPGANQRGFWGSLFPGLLTPDTLGMPAPGTTGPNEMPGARPQGVLSFASSQYDALIRREAERAGIDPVLFSRLIKRESDFDPRATGRAISGQGNARGLGQIMPATGADYGLTSITDFYDPEKNVQASANILRDYTSKLQKDFGDLEDLTKIALAAYNAGIGNVERAIRETTAIGEKVTYGQVLGRLPHPEQTGPYVEAIAGPALRGGSPAGAPSGALDPLASMSLTVGAAVNETLTGIAKFQEKMDALNASGLNFAGVLGKDITKGADELVKKFTDAANLLITFPGLLARMQPQQRELVSLAAQQVAAFQQRVLDETQSEGQARKRITEYQEFKRIQDAIDKEFEQEQRQRIHAAIQDNPIFSFGLVLSPEQEAALKEEAKTQHERLQEFAKTLDIFGLTLSPEQEAARAFTKKLEDTLAVLNAPRLERTEERLRTSLAPGMIPSPAQESLLAAITARETALSQERDMERIAQHLARNIQGTFDSMWQQIFSGGITSFNSFAVVLLQGIQRMFAQLTNQIMNQLLNALTNTTDEKGGWAGALAQGIVKAGASLFGSTEAPEGSDIPGMTNDPATISDLQSQIGALGARAAGGGVFRGLGMIRALAGGGILDRPSFALLGEGANHEAVVPLPDNKSIPVSFTGQQQAPQPIVIELHQSYAGAYDPRMLKTSEKEVLAWVIKDYKSDGPTRRTFTQR